MNTTEMIESLTSLKIDLVLEDMKDEADWIQDTIDDLEKNRPLYDSASDLLEACKTAVLALNQIPNTKLSPIVGVHKTTYSVCSMLGTIIEKTGNKNALQPKPKG